MSDLEKLIKLAEAANHLEIARKALLTIHKDGGNLSTDAKYYAGEIEQILSCDHGASGINALVRKVEEEVLC